MKFFVIEDIKAEDHLAQLFNRYISKLSLLDAVALPRETMRELRELKDLLHTEHGLETEEVERYFERESSFYSLTVLGNSLHNFHWAITNVVETLDTFFTEFEGDFHAYAVAQRYRHYQKFGSEDASDYDEAGRVLRKEDEESLKPWGLWEKLAEFFYDAGEAGHRHEQIGASAAEDFAEFTTLVARATAFSVSKLFEGMGHEVATGRVDEQGHLHVLNLPDRIEAELNQDLHNSQLARRFNSVWAKGQALAEFFRTMNQHDPAAFTQLLSDTQHLLAG